MEVIKMNSNPAVIIIITIINNKNNKKTFSF